jgi:hypothetical protein
MSIEPVLTQTRPRKGGPVTFFCATVLCGLVLSQAAQPKINYIELPKHLPLYVNIHFYTEPNRAFFLEYTEDLPSSPSATWSTLWVVPVTATLEHYVYSDLRTATRRFYRLRANPE